MAVKEIIWSLGVVNISIDRREVVTRNFNDIDCFISEIEQYGVEARHKILLSFDGYDDIDDEIYEISEIREYVNTVFEKHPNLFYFLYNFKDCARFVLACLFDVTTIVYKKKATVKDIVENNADITPMLIDFTLSMGLVEKIKKSTIDYALKVNDRVEDMAKYMNQFIGI